MYQELYTKDDLEIRGWNETLLKKLSKFSHELINDKKCWKASVVFNVELFPEAKNLNLPTYELLCDIQKEENTSIEKVLSHQHHKTRKNEIFLNICEMKSKDIDLTQYHTLYTDGCYMEELFFLGYGGYITDNKGQILTEYTEKIDSKELRHYHEFLGFIHGLKLAQDMELKKLLVLTDSLNNVLTIKNLHHLIYDKNTKCSPKLISEYVSNAKQLKLVCEAIELIKQFDDFKIYFIPREENKHADELSRQSLKRNKDVYYKGLEKSLIKTEKALSTRQKDEKSIFFTHPNLVHMDAMLNPFLDAKEKSNLITEQQKKEIVALSQEDKLYVLEDKHGENVFCVYHDKNNYEYFLNSVELPLKKSTETINHYEKEVEKVHYYALEDALEKITEIKIDNKEDKENLGIYFKNKHVIKLFQCSAKMDLDTQSFDMLCDIYEQMNEFKELRVRHSLDRHHLHADEVLNLMKVFEEIKYNENEFYQLKDYYSHNDPEEEYEVDNKIANLSNFISPNIVEKDYLNMNLTYQSHESDNKPDFIKNVKSVAHTLWKQFINLKIIKANKLDPIVAIDSELNSKQASLSLTSGGANISEMNIEDITTTHLYHNSNIQSKESLIYSQTLISNDFNEELGSTLPFQALKKSNRKI